MKKINKMQLSHYEFAKKYVRIVLPNGELTGLTNFQLNKLKNIRWIQ